MQKTIKLRDLLRLVKQTLYDAYGIKTEYEPKHLKGSTNLMSVQWQVQETKYGLSEIIIDPRYLGEDNLSDLAMQMVAVLHFNFCNIYYLNGKQIKILMDLYENPITVKGETPNDDYEVLEQHKLIQIIDLNHHGTDWVASLLSEGEQVLGILGDAML